MLPLIVVYSFDDLQLYPYCLYVHFLIEDSKVLFTFYAVFSIVCRGGSCLISVHKIRKYALI